MFPDRPLPTVHRPPVAASPGNRLGATLQAYFRSGWAFLIPYLAAYLLYAWLKWPVNPAAGGEEIVKGISVSGAISPSAFQSFSSSALSPPCLLHVYWFLHAMHLILGGIALSDWWKRRSAAEGAEKHSAFQLFSSSVFCAAPWLCLALIFWIPGVFLEWPSDPWEHLRRINEWHILDEVTAHSSWKKSSYFLPYSLTGHTAGSTQLAWLNLYYTAVCLLLCWQHYLLAHAVGLGMRASLVFVLLNLLTFGNNIFSFYRYYGLSSSIYAQIAAVALVRLVVEAFSRSEGSSRGKQFEHLVSGWPIRVAALLALGVLIAASHVQGLAVAGFAAIGVVGWRLLEWRRNALGAMALAALALSAATVLWFPQHPLLAESYQPAGWLSDWYGFKLWDLSSPAFDRAFQIFGLFGLLNLAAGFVLLRRNSIIGWLTVAPPMLLMMPIVAIPLATALTTNTLLAFHRVLFAVPAGLAVVGLLEGHFRRWSILTSAGLLLAVCLATTISSSSGLNRLWHTMVRIPTDQSLGPILRQVDELDPRIYRNDSIHLISNNITRDVLMSLLPIAERNPFRAINLPLLSAVGNTLEEIEYLHAISGQLTPDTKNSLVSGSSLHLHQLRFTVRTWPPRQLAGPETPWITLNDHAPVLGLNPINGRPVIANPPGKPSYAFTGPTIPVSQLNRYRISIKMRATPDAVSRNYLALAWYAGDGHLITLTDPYSPGIAGPRGWANGSFSYFGIVNEMPPAEWREYSVTFGFGMHVQIHRDARSVRIGALLNQDGAPQAVTQITELLVEQLSEPEQLVALLSDPLDYYTPKSWAGVLSRHWSADHLSVSLMGSRELGNALAESLRPEEPAGRSKATSSTH